MNEKQDIIRNTLTFLDRVTIKGSEIEDFYICKQYLISIYHSLEDEEYNIEENQKEEPKEEEPEEIKSIKEYKEIEKQDEIKKIDPEFKENKIKTDTSVIKNEETPENNDDFLDKVKKLMKGGK